MFPHGHFLLVALPLFVYSGIRYRRLPRGYTVLVVLVATQLPDLIDKPLAWTFGVIPSGRMLAHSLVIALLVLTIGCLILARYGAGRFGALFSVAYLSHIAGDFYPILWAGTDYYFFPNLFWPLLAANPDIDPSFAAHAPDLASLLLPLGVFFCTLSYIVLDLIFHPPQIAQRIGI